MPGHVNAGALGLTAKQEAFAQAVADGLSQTAAYRHAYDVEGSKQTTVQTNASTLANSMHVAPRILELKQAILDETIAARAWDLDRLVQESAVNVRLGRFLGQVGASNGALNTIGKAIGVLTDKVDVNVTHTLKPGLSLEELEGRIQRLDALESGVVEGEAVVLDE